MAQSFFESSRPIRALAVKRDECLKQLCFQRSNRRNAGCRWTAGYQPTMSAKARTSLRSPHEVRAKKVCRCSAAQDFVRSFVLFSVFRGSSFFSVTMKSHERHEQKNAKLLGSGELFKLRVDPFALTSCELPQKTNPKSKIQNRNVQPSAKKIKAPTRYLGWL